MNFDLICEDVGIAVIAEEVRRHDYLFRNIGAVINNDPAHPGYPHREMDVIALRHTPVPLNFMESAEARKAAEDELFAETLPAFGLFPSVRALMYRLMAHVRGTHLGRVSIVRLQPDGRVYPHMDTGLSIEKYSRYQVIVAAGAGSMMTCGGMDSGETTVEMREGQCWTFNALKLHHLHNSGPAARVHINFDIASD